MMEIRKLHSDEYSAALSLIWETFLHFEAPDYSLEGVQAFLGQRVLDLLDALGGGGPK